MLQSSHDIDTAGMLTALGSLTPSATAPALQVISRFERKGFKLAALKLMVPDKALAEEHYKDLSSKPFFPDLIDYIISGPVVAMVSALLPAWLKSQPRGAAASCDMQSSHERPPVRRHLFNEAGRHGERTPGKPQPCIESS